MFSPLHSVTDEKLHEKHHFNQTSCYRKYSIIKVSQQREIKPFDSLYIAIINQYHALSVKRNGAQRRIKVYMSMMHVLCKKIWWNLWQLVNITGNFDNSHYLPQILLPFHQVFLQLVYCSMPVGSKWHKIKPVALTVIELNYLKALVN